MARKDEALRKIQEAQRLDPVNAEYPEEAAGLLESLNRHADALASYDRALQLGSKNTAWIHIYKGTILHRGLKSLEKAWPELQQGIEGLLVEAERLPVGNPRRGDIASKLAQPLETYASVAIPLYKITELHRFGERLRSLDEYAGRDTNVTAATVLEAHRALGRRDFDTAIRLFSEIDSIAKRSANRRYEYEDCHAELFLRISKEARALAIRPVTPGYTMRILSLRTMDLKIKWKQGENQASTSPMPLNAGDIELANLAEDSLRQLVLAMSRGNLDLSFERIELPRTTLVRPGKRNSTGNGDNFISELTGPFGETLRSKLKQSDALLLFWYGNSPLTQHAGSQIVPYNDRSMQRGFINMGRMFFHYDNPYGGFNPSGVRLFPYVYMHELFHVIEARLGIKPNHGFRPDQRTNFPAWKGSDEIDYYAWQLGENIPKILEGRKRGWDALSFADDPGTLRKIGVLKLPVNFESDFGKMTFKQDKDLVTGTYEGEYPGMLEGKLVGRTLHFNWSQKDGTKGKGVFYFFPGESGQAMSFNGTWGTGDSDSDGGSWGGIGGN
ncbi:MAG: hypothetical protein K8S54_20360 [Spirochaetia bacterium]|nr:hypothetical protein [Spirochaetia bacterium]